MLGSPQFALPAPSFPFRALVSLAGRAPMGGVRETALATLLVARLAAGAGGAMPLPPALRRARAETARHWLGAIALPNPVRIALGRLVDATAFEEASGVAMALSKVTDVTAPHLDRASRSELERLTDQLPG